jgi:hypothetical protein
MEALKPENSLYKFLIDFCIPGTKVEVHGESPQGKYKNTETTADCPMFDIMGQYSEGDILMLCKPSDNILDHLESEFYIYLDKDSLTWNYIQD